MFNSANNYTYSLIYIQIHIVISAYSYNTLYIIYFIRTKFRY
nr:MAG TPA: UL92 family protein [Caudoviricetes sp.]